MATRMKVEESIRAYLIRVKQDRRKPIIYCGDLNVVADVKLDVWSEARTKKLPGCFKEEREAFKMLCKQVNLVDSFRILQPVARKFSWLPYIKKERLLKHGQRIDYFLVSKEMQASIINSDIIEAADYLSDHLPIFLKIKINNI